MAAQGCQLVLAVDRRELLQQVETVADGFAIRRLDERKRIDGAQAQVQHLQDHRGQVGPQDLWVSERGPCVEVLFAVKTYADARFDPTATALALVGAGLGYRLDRQTLDLGAVAVAADARGAAVDHIADARHGQRGFGNVGGQHYPAPGMGLEDLLLLGRRQARVQRQDLGMAQLGLAQDLGGIADLTLARQEHQHIAGALALAAFVMGQLIEGSEDRLVDGQVVLDPVALFVLFAGQRAVPGFHREGTAGHLDDRRPVEMLGEPLGRWLPR